MSELNYYNASKLSKRSSLQLVLITAVMFVIRIAQRLGYITQGVAIYFNIALCILMVLIVVIGCMIAKVINKYDQRYIEPSFFIKGSVYAVSALLFLIAAFKMVEQNSKMPKMNLVVLMDSFFTFAAAVCFIYIVYKCFTRTSEYTFIPFIVLIFWAIFSLVRNFIFIPVTMANPDKIFLMFIAITTLVFIFMTAKVGLGYKTKTTKYMQIVFSMLLIGVCFGYLLPNIIIDLTISPSTVKGEELSYLAVAFFAIATSIKYICPAVITRKVYNNS